MPKSSVSIGTITTPPPRPVREPSNPASREPKPTTRVNCVVVRESGVIARG